MSELKSIQDEVDINGLLSLFAKNIVTILSLSGAFAIIFYVYSIFLDDQYRAEAVLSGAIKNESQNNSSGFSNIASFAGFNIPSDVQTKKILTGIETMKSKKFLSEILEDEMILISLMASKSWDPKANELEIDPTIYDVKENNWVRKVSFPKTAKPSIIEAHEKFMDIFSIGYSREDEIIKISLQHHSPIFAKELLGQVIVKINELSRQKDIEIAENSIRFLYEQINDTQLTEVKQGLSQLVQNQIQKIMVAKASPEYLFVTLDPPLIPEERVAPNRLLISFFGAVIGLLISLALIFRKEFT